MQTFSIERKDSAARVRRGAAPAAVPVHELTEVVGGLSGPISARLAAEMAKQVKVPEKKLRVLFEIAIPGVLQAELENSLLASGPEFRAKRAKLAHVLSSAELAEAVPAVMEAMPGIAEAAPGEDPRALTSEEAADLLHVSRSHVNALADAGTLGEVMRTAGGHRRLSRAQVLAYKEQCKRTQAKGLEAMIAASEKAGLYDLELKAAPRRRRSR